jgi:DivIVA domain-containing protein
VELDRQTVERRDFPISRRGYDPAAVDAHLRALAVEIEELQRAVAGGGRETTLASNAGTQVQGILAAAEAAAADIESQARSEAQRTREEADSDAQQTREEAIAKARSHVAAVAQVAATLLERVGGMDTEVRALIDNLRSGGGRLTADLAAVDASMGELYDAASGGAGTRTAADAAADARSRPKAPTPAPPDDAPPPITADAIASAGPGPKKGAAKRAAAEPAAGAAGAAQPKPAADADLDGARLIALNMALNGDSRADTERYLAENFELSDRGKLVDEVYAAIER